VDELQIDLKDKELSEIISKKLENRETVNKEIVKIIPIHVEFNIS
jgi:hypothetical protein